VGPPELVAAAPERDGAPEPAPRGESDQSVELAEAARELPAPARLEPERYCVQFTAGDEYVKLVEKAQALLSYAAERIPLDELQLRAMRAFVAELERTKRAKTTHATTVPECAEQQPAAQDSHTKRQARNEPTEDAEVTEARRNPPRQRGRRVPAAVRRAVFERDQGRCAYLDGSGQRCRETHCLELHHLRPFARGGEQTLANLALRCAAHNALAAEQDFGADFIQRRRDSNRHESHRNQGEG
jgi:5-methylcytosine-specific restriction endonuclease McrA